MTAQDQPNSLESGPQPGLSTPSDPTSTLERDDPNCQPSDLQNRLISPLMTAEQTKDPRTKQRGEEILAWAERIIAKYPYIPPTDSPSSSDQSTMAMEQSNDLHTEAAEKNVEDILAWARRFNSEHPYGPPSGRMLTSNQSIPCCCTHNEKEAYMEKLDPATHHPDDNESISNDPNCAFPSGSTTPFT